MAARLLLALSTIIATSQIVFSDHPGFSDFFTGRTYLPKWHDEYPLGVTPPYPKAGDRDPLKDAEVIHMLKKTLKMKPKKESLELLDDPMDSNLLNSLQTPVDSAIYQSKGLDDVAQIKGLDARLRSRDGASSSQIQDLMARFPLKELREGGMGELVERKGIVSDEAEERAIDDKAEERTIDDKADKRPLNDKADKRPLNDKAVSDVPHQSTTDNKAEDWTIGNKNIERTFEQVNNKQPEEKKDTASTTPFWIPKNSSPCTSTFTNEATKSNTKEEEMSSVATGKGDASSNATNQKLNKSPMTERKDIISVGFNVFVTLQLKASDIREILRTEKEPESNDDATDLKGSLSSIGRVEEWKKPSKKLPNARDNHKAKGILEEDMIKK